MWTSVFVLAAESGLWKAALTLSTDRNDHVKASAKPDIAN